MDFFESQARAHRNTKWLLVYFALAVIGIILTLHVVAALVFGESLTDWRLLGMVAGGVIVVVTLGSLFRIAELSQGGAVVAQMLGGRPVEPHTTDLDEQRLRNVVEEMALASGVPVPEIYVLDAEEGINAFAAGNTTGDAVVAVTRGALKNLSRDELQGVVAHEFSHILNGDMRLNVRLIGVLTGILLLAILGRIVFDMAGWSRVRSSRSGNSSQVPIVLIGLALFAVGYIGVFFAKLIKAAVSRQREFLADASAVQFTRNPDGIAGALYKIGKAGSRLNASRADEASHMFFGNGLGDAFIGWFATHPPIEARIRAINPQFDPASVRERREEAPSEIRPATRVTGGNLAVAATILAGLPDFARNEANAAASAAPLIYSLLLSGDPEVREKQLAAIELTPGQRQQVDRDLARRTEINDALALMDLCLPALRRLSDAQYAVFRENVRKLIAADDRVDLFEFVLHKALVRHVDHFFTKSGGPTIRVRSLIPILPDVSVVLSALAWQSGETDAERDAAFAAGVSALNIKPGAFPMERAATVDFPRLEAALDRIVESDPPTRRKVFHACVAAVRHDGVVRPREAALLRAVSDVLDCPLPPLQ